MTTPTTKPVRRVSIESDRDRSKFRRIIVTIGPGDLVSFRHERTRTSFTLTVKAAMQYAQRLTADADRRRKAQERKERNAAKAGKK